MRLRSGRIIIYKPKLKKKKKIKMEKKINELCNIFNKINIKEEDNIDNLILCMKNIKIETSKTFNNDKYLF